MKYYRVRMFFNLFSKHYTILRLEDIFWFKKIIFNLFCLKVKIDKVILEIRYQEALLL